MNANNILDTKQLEVIFNKIERLKKWLATNDQTKRFKLEVIKKELILMYDMLIDHTTESLNIPYQLDEQEISNLNNATHYYKELKQQYINPKT